MTTYDAARIFFALREVSSPVLQRKAMPYLLQNTSGQALKLDDKGNIAPPGAFIVVQPSGAFHTTARALHADPIDASRLEPFCAQQFAITSNDQVQHAIAALKRLNPAVNLDAELQALGWGQSISQTRAYQITPALNGAILHQPWGSQTLNTDTHVLVCVEGNNPDCYANPKADMKDWFDATGRASSLFLDALPAVTEAMLANAMHRPDPAATLTLPPRGLAEPDSQKAR